MEHRRTGGRHLRHRSNSRPSKCKTPSLSFSILFLLLSLFSSSSMYASAANTYLLNCGTSTTTAFEGRDFGPDNSGTGLFKREGPVVPVLNPNPMPNASPLYSTASVFPNVTTYKFGISDPGTLFVRLHFSPFFANGYNLASASFQVTAMDKSLLLLANLPSKFPVIKEYLLWFPTPGGQLSISFIPTSGSYAYVNAIEVFTSPNLYMNMTNPTPIGSPAFSGAWGQQLMENVYRVNAGGPRVSYPNDTLHRTWDNDDRFLFIKTAAAKNSTSLPIPYPTNGPPTPEFAPPQVYATLEEMNLSGASPNALFNITWNFTVASGYNYLLRMHFYDFISSTVDALIFNVFINDQAGTLELRPGDKSDTKRAMPFYMDYVTAVMDSPSIRVSVGPISRLTGNARNAILNGIEIWKVNNSAGSLDGPFNGNGSGGGSGGSSSSSSKTVLIAAVAAGAVVILILAGTTVFCIRRGRAKSVQTQQEQVASEKSQEQGSRMTREGSMYTNIIGAGNGNSITVSSQTNSEGRSVASSMVNFNLHIALTELAEATNRFDEDLVIGAGGFGKVYKGMLRDGTHIAAKRASLSSKQGIREFQNEIMLLSQIRHRHLVSLIGFCNEHDEMILVYEFMEKGTLKDLLYGPHKVHLTWRQRLEICIGSARGLHYLHTGFTKSIIHRDIKSSNILLGTNFIAKVSDFGLSRVNESVDQIYVSTAVKGSFGYLDPEYFKTQKLTGKSDVYSFGVLLFEVLCARPALDQSAPRDQLNLAEWATECYRQSALEEIVDPGLRGDIDPNSLRKFAETAVKCLAEYGSDRPSIGDVLWSLEYVMQLHVTGGVGQREPFDDSVNVDSQLPTVVRPILPPHGRFGGNGSDDSEVTSSNVFSQLITGEGR